ncbi:MAG TPA: hypothetical protein VMR86_09125 [Myxococcota bacterium]|nr:hypothetical protein [Myxococcota bacterium]
MTRSVAGVALCALLALAACDRPQGEPPASTAPARDEDLGRLVPSLVDSIQAKQASFVMDHVSTGFKEDGGLDYYDVRSLVETAALRSEAVGARLESSQLTAEPDGRQRVSARVSFALGQRLAPGEALPEGAVVYAIEVVFAKNGAKWQAVGGRYRREVPPVTSAGTPSMATR